MTDLPLFKLPWLSPAPDDFTFRCETMIEGAEPHEATLRGLALHQLNVTQLTRLSKTLDNIRARKADISPLVPFRLGILSNGTVDIFAQCLPAAALRYGIALEIIHGPFDQAISEAMDKNSAINRANPDAVLLALDHRGVGLQGTGDGGGGVDGALDHIRTLRQGLKDGCGCSVIFQTIAPPIEPLFGHLDLKMRNTLLNNTNEYNSRLSEEEFGDSDVLLDVAFLANTVGLDNWHDPIQWNVAKLSFSQKYVPYYCDHVGRLLGAMVGRSKKCLVLDLDNVLWGGTLGDDGLEGIVLGQGNPVGEAFLDVQKMALRYKKRGVLLAVCSKNDESLAKRAFLEHPDMVLKESDISAFAINWNDKAGNLEAIAETLNIGVDALVMIDDSPVERAQIRDALPEVSVPEMPDEPALYARLITNAGYFETLSFTDDDRKRSDQYRTNSQRDTLKRKSRNLDEFLKSLDMVLTVSPFDAMGRKRIAQLINKTNQFNLTTRRYTELQIEEIERDSVTFTIQARLLDKFGDNGVISIVICRKEGNDWLIDTWLMSCRVINRSIEKAILDYLVSMAAAEGIKKLIGEYFPNGRNDLVADHYSNLGFKPAKQEKEKTIWHLPVSGYVHLSPPIKVDVN